MTGGTVTMSSLYDVVDVDLHDFEAPHHGAHLRADQGAEMAVKIMRRH
jgi:hypothetical protein